MSSSAPKKKQDLKGGSSKSDSKATPTQQQQSTNYTTDYTQANYYTGQQPWYGTSADGTTYPIAGYEQYYYGAAGYPAATGTAGTQYDYSQYYNTYGVYPGTTAANGYATSTQGYYGNTTTPSTATTTQVYNSKSSSKGYKGYTATGNTTPNVITTTPVTTPGAGIVNPRTPDAATPTELGGGSKKKRKKLLRSAGGEVWEDSTLDEWPANDFRIFVGDLGPEVTDEMLHNAFSKYNSLAKTKIVRDKRTQKPKGYGFVSILDANDFIKAMREMNGKYVGNRPMKLRKSDWKDRNISTKSVKKDRELQMSYREAKKAKKF
ncbi:hypothetical protein H4219_005662 [Mycoemilia scoparia]|uniref:RRM domain-containing protein n=1 Tax=Mycoemilia scoparia TaxID=417184 RepID=A0A9W7ZNH1_9FUNG|nr:hypothetical protein H4219_005662 [Mycoemilia scoparia]